MVKKSDSPELNTTNSEEWNNLLSQEGLIVVDVFAKWAGPCNIMRPLIYKVKGKLQVSAEDILQYGTACSDGIPELDCFKNICTPTFLFFAAGSLVAFMHGADGAKMRETIIREVKQEMMVTAGKAERLVLDLIEAVPNQYEETEEEREMGGKTVQNMKTFKKKVMVGAIMNKK